MKEIRTLIYISLLLMLLQLMHLLACREQSIVNIHQCLFSFLIVQELMIKSKISIAIIILLKVLWLLQLLLLLFHDFIRECMYRLWLLLFLNILLIQQIRRSFLEVLKLRILLRHASELRIFLERLILLNRLIILVALLRERIFRIVHSRLWLL